MTWLRAIPLWAWTLVGGLVVGSALGWWVNGARWEARLSVAQKEYAEERQGLAERAQEAEAKQRRIERERQQAVDEVERHASEQIEVARADAARAGSALDRLQQRYEAATASIRACGNSITTQLGQAANDAARVHADVLGRVGKAAQLYADVADRRGIAGAACVAAYDSLEGGSR